MNKTAPKPRHDKTIVTIKAEREGEDTIVDRQSYPATIDKVCKQLRGLTGKQAYDLRTKRYVQFDNGGWLTTVSVQEITAMTDLGPAAT